MSEVNVLALSHLFSRTVMQQLAETGRSPLAARLIHESGAFRSRNPALTIRDIFNSAFSLLQERGRRNDYIFRTAVIQKKLLGTHSLKTASMLSEFRIGLSRADLVMLNGSAMVYELKSDRDSMSRLRYQLEDYRRVFAAATILTDERHVTEVSRLAHPNVGIAVLTERWRISTVREAQVDHTNIDPRIVLDSLRIGEAEMVLRHLGYELPALPNTRVRGAIGEIFRTIDPATLQHSVTAILTKSRSHAAIADFVTQLPISLVAASLPLRWRCDASRVNLLNSLEVPLSRAMQWK